MAKKKSGGRDGRSLERVSGVLMYKHAIYEHDNNDMVRSLLCVGQVCHTLGWRVVWVGRHALLSCTPLLRI